MTLQDQTQSITDKLKAYGLVDEQIQEIAELIGQVTATVVQEALGPAQAGRAEIGAFEGAALALTPLSDGMRARVLDALEALLLPPPAPQPSVLDALAGALPAVLEALRKNDLPGGEDPPSTKIDKIVLENGEQLVGTVVYEGGKVWLSDDFNNKVEIAPEDVKKYMEALGK